MDEGCGNNSKLKIWNSNRISHTTALPYPRLAYGRSPAPKASLLNGQRADLDVREADVAVVALERDVALRVLPKAIHL